MAILVQKKQKVESSFKMVKLQLLLHAFFNDVHLTDADLECATKLAINGFSRNFFKEVVRAAIFKSEQSARNCMSKLKVVNLAVRDGKNWTINPELSLGVDQIILLDLKVKN